MYKNRIQARENHYIHLTDLSLFCTVYTTSATQELAAGGPRVEEAWSSLTVDDRVVPVVTPKLQGHS